MNAPRDALLDMPLDDAWMRGLLMFAFSLHLLFVLLTLGTAMLGGSLIAAGIAGRRRSLGRWGREMLKAFFVHKSLAIVLGVGPILLMQVGHSVPFLTGVNLFAPLWLWLVVLLGAGLLFVEAAADGWVRQPVGVFLCVIGGLACMIAVPSIFAAVVVATENPGRWNEVLARGGRLPPELAVHWLARVGHVLMAAVIFAAALQFVRKHNRRKREILAAWMTGSLLIQAVLGITLWATVPRRPQGPIAVVLLTGASLAGLWIWRLYQARARRLADPARGMIVLPLALLIAMLLGRQLLQDQVLVPVGRQLAVNRDRYQQAVTAGAGGIPLAANVETQPAPSANAPTIYLRSCAFCHGMVGNGEGDVAPQLHVPPENLTELRMSDRTLHGILLDGVPGTAMPTFGYYTRDELDELIRFLRSQMNLGYAPEPLPRRVPPESASEAATVFSQTCGACHQANGRPTTLAAGLDPAPPDLSELAISPEYAFTIISRGYPGTQMPSFDDLPEATRWGLVELVRGLYRGSTKD